VICPFDRIGFDHILILVNLLIAFSYFYLRRNMRLGDLGTWTRLAIFLISFFLGAYLIRKIGDLTVIFLIEFSI
jgi:UPF0716 family protein affecting phage T7 exclusion